MKGYFFLNWNARHTCPSGDRSQCGRQPSVGLMTSAYGRGKKLTPLNCCRRSLYLSAGTRVLVIFKGDQHWQASASLVVCHMSAYRIGYLSWCIFCQCSFSLATHFSSSLPRELQLRNVKRSIADDRLVAYRPAWESLHGAAATLRSTTFRQNIVNERTRNCIWR